MWIYIILGIVGWTISGILANRIWKEYFIYSTKKYIKKNNMDYVAHKLWNKSDITQNLFGSFFGPIFLLTVFIVISVDFIINR